MGRRGWSGGGPVLGFILAVCGTMTAAEPDLFQDGTVVELGLTLTSADIGSLRASPRRFVPATVSEGARTYEAVAVRLKGSTGSFRSVDDRPAFTLDFERLRPGQRFHGLRRLYLHNAVEDPTRLNELLGGELFRAAGVPAPRVAHARVRLNGRALGLYVLKEGFTEDFLARHFRRSDGDLYDNDWGHDVDQPLHRNFGPGEDRQVEQLADVAAAVQDPDLDRRFARLESGLDVDRFLSFLAMEVILVHRDGYALARNNFRIYHDPEGQRLVFLPDGYDQLFGITNLPWKPHMAGLVARGILETREGQRRYAERLRELVGKTFQAQALADRLDQVTRALAPALSRGEGRELSRQVASLKALIVAREASLRHQLDQPEIQPLEFRDGVARVAGWYKADEPAGGRLDRGLSPDAVESLHIVAGPTTGASWRVKVRLRTGRYRFEGQGKVANVVPLPFGRASGAGFRVSGRERAGPGLVGSSPWQLLAAEFEVTAAVEDAELLCELRASAGEFWVDVDSLRVVEVLAPSGSDRGALE